MKGMKTAGSSVVLPAASLHQITEQVGDAKQKSMGNALPFIKINDQGESCKTLIKDTKDSGGSPFSARIF